MEILASAEGQELFVFIVQNFVLGLGSGVTLPVFFGRDGEGIIDGLLATSVDGVQKIRGELFNC